jgi:hypothetical protein
LVAYPWGRKIEKSEYGKEKGEGKSILKTLMHPLFNIGINYQIRSGLSNLDDKGHFP